MNPATGAARAQAHTELSKDRTTLAHWNNQVKDLEHDFEENKGQMSRDQIQKEQALVRRAKERESELLTRIHDNEQLLLAGWRTG